MQHAATAPDGHLAQTIASGSSRFDARGTAEPADADGLTRGPCGGICALCPLRSLHETATAATQQ